MTNDVLNHTWQSTAFAAVCALLTRTLRTIRAHVRYALWMAASAKFLIPFDLLISLGKTLGHWLLPPTAGRQVAVVLEFSQRTVDPAAARASALFNTVASAPTSLVPTAILVVWAVGT